MQDKKTWKVCENVDLEQKEKEGGKRRLVGLGEANEVAKRLAGKMNTGAGRVGSGEANGSDGEEWRGYKGYGNRYGSAKGRQDVVAEWMGGL